VLRLRLPDEAKIAGVFQQLLAEFPDVNSGSYPSEPGCLNPQLFISLESKDECLLKRAFTRFQSLLDEHHDKSLHVASCLIGVDSDVLEFARSRSSLDQASSPQ
jgi:hypothetical protein